MRFLLLSLLSTFICGLIVAQNPNPSPIIDTYISDQMDAEDLPGVSTVVVKDGQVVWLESYGFANIANNVPVEDNTVFMLASISKVFTGTAVMRAQEQGFLNIDANVNDYLPWDLTIPDYPSIPVTTRHLSTHTASIYDDSEVTDNYYGYPDPTISLAECMAAYFSMSGEDYDDYWNFYSNAPGTLYEYSNMGSALNGYMVEVSTGQLFDDYCDENLFVPLGMDNTAWHYADFDPAQIATPYQYTGGEFIAYNQYGFADYPNGQLRSNVLDLSKFMMAYLNGGTFGSTSILSSTSIDEMLKPQITSLDANQGISWYTEEFTFTGGSKNLWGHNGGEQGVSTEMYLDPDTNIGVCVLTNGEGSAFGIAEKLYDYGLGIVTTSQSDVSVSVDNLELFPNPVESIFSISGQVGEYTVEIIDGIGQVYQTIEATDDVSIDISGLPSGLFFVSISNSTIGEGYLKKMVKTDHR